MPQSARRSRLESQRRRTGGPLPSRTPGSRSLTAHVVSGDGTHEAPWCAKNQDPVREDSSRKS